MQIKSSFLWCISGWKYNRSSWKKSIFLFQSWILLFCYHSSRNYFVCPNESIKLGTNLKPENVWPVANYQFLNACHFFNIPPKKNVILSFLAVTNLKDAGNNSWKQAVVVGKFWDIKIAFLMSCSQPMRSIILVSTTAESCAVNITGVFTK